jgi:hypothetical protein
LPVERHPEPLGELAAGRPSTDVGDQLVLPRRPIGCLQDGWMNAMSGGGEPLDPLGVLFIEEVRRWPSQHPPPGNAPQCSPAS